VSLTGKVRYVLQGEKRIQELVRRGFPQILVPGRNADEFSGGGGSPPGLRLEAVADVAQAVRYTTARSTSG
jgi:predicted ATP-dependent serine protease